MSRQGCDFHWKSRDANVSKTPTWKEKYRERCKERLRENRYKLLLEKRRSDSQQTSHEGCKGNEGLTNKQRVKNVVMNDIQSMMSSEWELLQKEERSCEGIMPEDMPAPSIDEKIALMEEILEELKLERQKTLNEEEFCEEHVKQEEAELNLSFHRLHTEEVVCPVCQKNCLDERRGIISCRCGLTINTEQDCISLKNVSDNLRQGTTQHSDQCGHTPSFSQMDEYGINSLIMTCQECDFYFIII